LAAILDFSATDLFYNETNGSIEYLDPKNICLDTNINLLAKLVTKL